MSQGSSNSDIFITVILLDANSTKHLLVARCEEECLVEVQARFIEQVMLNCTRLNAKIYETHIDTLEQVHARAEKREAQPDCERTSKPKFTRESVAFGELVLEKYYDDLQRSEILRGFQQGLSFEQVGEYASWKLSAEQMREAREKLVAQLSD